MSKFLSILPRWFPALAFMAIIFAFSSTPSVDLPYFASWDYLVKNGGHFIGYGLLALSYLYGMGWKKERRWLAWLLAVLYAASDEFHQSFVSGRNPSIFDVMIFDNLGALAALYFYLHYRSMREAKVS
jgi:VanZ family protein